MIYRSIHVGAYERTRADSSDSSRIQSRKARSGNLLFSKCGRDFYTSDYGFHGLLVAHSTWNPYCPCCVTQFQSRSAGIGQGVKAHSVATGDSVPKMVAMSQTGDDSFVSSLNCISHGGHMRSLTVHHDSGIELVDSMLSTLS